MKLNRKHLTSEQFIDTPIIYEGSEKYHPVSHRRIVETVEEYLDTHGLLLEKRHYLTNSKGTQAMGIYVLGELNSEMNYEIAWRNSLDGTMSFQIVSGSEVAVCSNSNMWGEFSYKRKHLGEKTTYEIIEHLKWSINNYDSILKQHTEMSEVLKNIDITPTYASELAGRLFIQEELITATQLSLLKKEIIDPTYDYNAKNSLWELYNGCTHSVKETTPKLWVNTHRNLADFFMDKIVEEKSPIFSGYTVVEELI